VVAVGGGDVLVADQAQDADGEAAERCMTRGAFPVLTSVILLVSRVPHPAEAVFYLPVAVDPGGEDLGIGAAVGDQVDALDRFLALLGDGAAQLRDLGSALELDPGGRQDGLDRGAAALAAVARGHRRDCGDQCPRQLFELQIQHGHVGLDGHHVVRLPAQDRRRGVMLRVQRVDRQDRPDQVGERLQQLAHRGNLVALLIHLDLAEDRAAAVRQGCHQVRCLPAPRFRAADGLAVHRDNQAPADPSPAPRAQGRVQRGRPPERRLVRRSPDRAQGVQHVAADVGGSLADRGERPRPRDDRSGPQRKQPAERVTDPATAARVRDLGEQVKKVLAAGRWEKMASVGGRPS